MRDRYQRCSSTSLGNDTNAAIAGGLLGARDGASAIPQQWRALLQFRDEFTEAATILASSVT
ncbi:MAG: ADP-ribosylglycohydrolase family protein [Streptosporangiaceae bacterium]